MSPRPSRRAAADRATNQHRATSYETNDDAGGQAAPPLGPSRGVRVEATIDFWDDHSDVYAVSVLRARQQRLGHGLCSRRQAHAPLPVEAGHEARRRPRPPLAPRRHASRPAPARGSTSPYRAPKTGTYYVQVKLGSRGAGQVPARARQEVARLLVLEQLLVGDVAQDARGVPDDDACAPARPSSRPRRRRRTPPRRSRPPGRGWRRRRRGRRGGSSGP